MRRLFAYNAVIVILLGGCQKPCNLTIAQAPALRGFRLGMKSEELKERFPSFPQIRMNDLGMAKISITFDAIVENVRALDDSNFVVSRVNFAELADVRKVEISFVDGQAFEIAIFYADRDLWQSPDQFLSHISSTLKIPDSWKSLDFTEDYKNQRCGEVTVYAGFKSIDASKSDERYPFIELTDLNGIGKQAVREVDKRDREKQKAEEQRKAFQP